MTAGSHAQTKFTVQVKDKDAQHVYLGGCLTTLHAL